MAEAAPIGPGWTGVDRPYSCRTATLPASVPERYIRVLVESEFRGWAYDAAIDEGGASLLDHAADAKDGVWADGVAIDVDGLSPCGAHRGGQTFSQCHCLPGRNDGQDEVGVNELRVSCVCHAGGLGTFDGFG